MRALHGHLHAAARASPIPGPTATDGFVLAVSNGKQGLSELSNVCCPLYNAVPRTTQFFTRNFSSQKPRLVIKRNYCTTFAFAQGLKAIQIFINLRKRRLNRTFYF